MGWAQTEFDTQTAVIDTEHTLGTDPTLTDGTLVLMVDMTNMADGDVTILRFYEKVTGTGDTQMPMILGTVAGVQTNLLWFSVPVLSLFGAKFTLEQTDGTGRDFDWSIRAIT
jgi:hypothetical protein